MRSDLSKVNTEEHRARPQTVLRRRAEVARKAKLRRFALESLEARELLAQLPAALVSAPVQVSISGGNYSSPSIAVDPTNSNNLAMVWTRIDPALTSQSVRVEGARSTNGGASWTAFTVYTQKIDPSTASGTPALYAQATDPAIAFDRQGNFHVVVAQHSADNNNGEIQYNKINFSTLARTSVVLANWESATTPVNRGMKPSIAVDSGLASFTDTDSNGNPYTQTTPGSGNVYVAWSTNDDNPASIANWNPNAVRMRASFDNGATFGAAITVNAGGNGGTQRNTAPRITVSQGTGTTAGGQVTVVWDDFGTGATATPPVDLIRVQRYRPQAGALVAVGGNITAATSLVRGQQGYGGLTTSAAQPLGIGPAPTIASDNTLGAFSPFQGRLYLTYVGRFDDANNPATNTDIYLITSDNGGASWSGPVRVNDDVGINDGYSGADLPLVGFNGPTDTIAQGGRAQMMPSVAVDSATGTLVISYSDTRFDAAQARVATMIATSIDGGASFGPQTFANASQRVTDQATGQSKVLGPIPDNTSGGNNMTGKDGTFGFGDRQGLAVSGGKVYPAWSSNINGGNAGTQLLRIRVGQATIAAGPRVINGTMGPVGLSGDTLNGNTLPDGSPLVQSLIVEFDRPIDPSTFTPGTGTPNVTVFAADFESGLNGFTIDNNGPDGLPGTADDGLWHQSTGRGGNAGHSASNSIYYGRNETASGGGNYDTGSTNSGTLTSPVINLPAGANLDLAFKYFITTEGGSPTFDVARISVFDVALGTTTALGDNSAGSLMADPSNGFLSVSSDLSAFAGRSIRLVFSFDTVDNLFNNFEGLYVDDVVITSIGLPGDAVIVARDASGNLLATQPTVTAITPLDNGQFGATQFRVDFTAQSTPGTYSYTIGPDIGDRIRRPGVTGNLMDQNGNARTNEIAADRFSAPRVLGTVPFQAPYDRDTLPLVVPGPHVVSTSVPGEPATADNLVLNKTVSSIEVTFDRDMNPSTFEADGRDVLRVQGPAGLIPAPYTVASVNARTFRITFPTQQLSGTYTITLGPEIRSATGLAIDNNLNAGVDALRGTSNTTPASLKFNSTGTVVIAPNRTVSSTIQITDDFVIQNLALQLNIAHSKDPDLEARLIGPDGTSILLFSGVGSTGNQSNFNNTIFDDTAGTPIANGGPDFFGRFRPQQPLGVLVGRSSVSGPSGLGAGVYTLQITNKGTVSGLLSSWNLTLGKPVTGTGLGELVADRTLVDFRIFTMDPTNPLASTTWTSVGPASILSGSGSGRIGGIAVDPSDPSGNTVYVAGATGGVWKTTNFLTNDPNGPIYIPLTDFGQTLGVNIGGISVFGRNNDPNQSIVIVSTGDGDGQIGGVGFLRSTDGGATWTLLDSTNNNLPFAQRNHSFVGNTSFKVVVDPRPSPSGQVIIYAAMNSGLWRSTDTGNTWTLARAGFATDVLLDPGSGPIDAVANPTGNLQVVYAAFRGDGVYISPNKGQVWSQMLGGVGNPLEQDPATNNTPVPVLNQGATPNGAKGRIVLAKPELIPSSEPNAALKNLIYQGWLFAYVATPNDFQDGLYVTKDQGQNWTRIRIPGLAPIGTAKRVVPSNDTGLPDYDVLGDPAFQGQGNYDIAITIDPNDPNIIYLGGFGSQPSGFVRVDINGLGDPHAYYLANDRPDGGTLMVNATDGATMKQNPLPGVQGPISFLNIYGDPRSTPTVNLIRNPFNPLGGSATFYTPNISSLNNTGAGAKWVPIDQFMGGADIHRLVAFRDPLTGKSRLIIGNDHGVWSTVDNGDGTIDGGIGTAIAPSLSRNGNLQITQFYYGAAQPSSAAAQIAQALFYGQAQDDGFPRSTADVLTTGNIFWGFSAGGDGAGVATDQTGTGTLYQYNWPCCGGNKTDFFLVNGVGRTFGLIQASGGGQVPDPQWPNTGGFNFAVNPINGNQIVISSGAGRVFRTQDQGQFWLVIGEPAALDGTNAQALAYGAPLPSDPTGALDNFIYAGTVGGNIFITTTGGGANGNAWTNLTSGLDGSSVQSIVTNPTRGSREAFAVTRRGVYYMADSLSAGATWQNISGNVFGITQNAFGNPSFATNKLQNLNAIIADWRYVIPDNAANANSPTHPMLYVAGNGGVYRSTDKGQSWSLFPTAEPNSYYASPNPAGPNAGLPNADVRDLDFSLGNIDPTNGRPVAKPGDPNILLATTYGRGSFAIRLAPVVFQNTLQRSATVPSPGGSDGGTNNAGQPLVTVPQPAFEGLSQQTAFGHVARITIVDLTNPANPRIIGGYDPSDASTDIVANQTDSAGRFSVQVKPGGFSTNGIKTIGIRATDASGTVGNLATYTFELKTDFVNVNAPPVMPTIALLPADDTSGGLLITKIPTPRITGVTDPLVTVNLFLADSGGNPVGSSVATGTSNANGVYTIPFANLGDGTYRVVAVATNSFGNSPVSGVLTFQIKTNAPTTKPTFGLLPADDTGLPLDNVTSIHRPRFVGVTEANGKVQLYRVVNGARVGAPLALTTADASGNFSIQLPNALNNGTITLQVGVTDVAGNQGPYSDPTSVSIITVAADFVGTGKTTPSLFRRDPVNGGLWFAQGVTPTGGVPFGSSSLDIPFTGDVDGDGISDRMVYRPSEQKWFIQRSSGGTSSFVLGTAGETPVTGDIDGDGKIDVGVFNPTNGTWTFAGSTAGTVFIGTPVTTPAAGDIPVPGNYNGVGGDEVAIYRPSTKQFFIQGVALPVVVTTGDAGIEEPVPGNYDDSYNVGTGVAYRNTEPAVYNRSTGKWAILRPNGQVQVVNASSFQAGDIPAPGDYDGDGRTDIAVFRPSTSAFIVNGTTLTTFGVFGDIPLTSPLVYRNIVTTTATIALSTGTDTGIKGDNRTSSRRPVFTGVTTPGAVVDLIRVDTANPANSVVVGSATADGSGVYSIGLSPAADLLNGSYTVQARARNLGGAVGPASSPLTVKLVTTEGDYNGDGISDLAVFRRVNPSQIDWFVKGSAAVTFGAGGLDVPLAADFNGDGKLEPAIYRQTTAEWFSRRPGAAGDLLTPNGFGWANVDIPVPADYDGDGKTDIAVYRPQSPLTASNGAGNWYIRNANGTATVINTPNFALAGDIPVPGDYNGDGIDEPAFYRPSSSTWFILGPGGLSAVPFGGPNDIPVPGVYDSPTSGRKFEPAVFRPSTGQYFVLGPNGGRLQSTFAAGDIPAPGDYNGDGLTDATVYRGSANQWLTSTLSIPAVTPINPKFGGPTDVPPVAPYQYRLPNRSGGTINLASKSSALTTLTTAPAVTVSALDMGSTARALGSGLSSLETPEPADAPTDVFNRTPRVRRNRVVVPHVVARRFAPPADSPRRPSGGSL